MKRQLLSMMEATKKKAGVALLCGALLATLGTGTALAANSIASAKTGLQVKVENGVRLYSTDGGKTWSKNPPDGVTVSEQDGKITFSNGTPPKDGEGKGTLFKMENGVGSYSTDGGKTWGDKAPDGAQDKVTIGEDGKVTHKQGNPSEAPNGTGLHARTELAVKIENGVRLYSTDGGKTWSQTPPDGLTVDEQDGKITFSNGTPPKGGEGKGVLYKVENGVESYSTDGGKTWSAKAPDGAEDSTTIGN
ncbi:WD40/YVTN/BNR-like repeat-containing protein [Gordoniibacillus kamchatkensis]|uniref:WD40/YVTN/BNR-like repeat-containing protein n=1 Tax=Gordoniibacillus kamchatkensis TaxID=1590651 RepID=UPI0009E37132|nr:sialidase family protein [Paenibacillus sp. VKM B-2647]